MATRLSWSIPRAGEQPKGARQVLKRRQTPSRLERRPGSVLTLRASDEPVVSCLFREQGGLPGPLRPTFYPPALPTGPPGSVMRQGSSSSSSRFSERTFCSLAIWRTVLPDL